MATVASLHPPLDRRRFIIGGGTVLALAAVAGGGALVVADRTSAMASYSDAQRKLRRALSADPSSLDLIRFATLAPSGHNTQPWRFRLRSDGIDILTDTIRRTPVVDPDDHHLYVGLGAAAENLKLADAAAGTPGEWHINPVANMIAFRFATSVSDEPSLFAAITRRRSSRTDYDGGAVSAAVLRDLRAAAITPGIDLVFLTGAAELARFRNLVLTGNVLQMADPAFLRELKHWIRFNPRAALASGDGLFSAASGSPVLPQWLGPALFDQTFTAASENDKYARQLRSTPVIAVFSGEQADPSHWVDVGRAAQRVALRATALGLAHAFMNQAVEVPAMRADLAVLAGLPGRRPDLVMRLGHGPTLPFSPRRAVASLLA
jgi:nitroreductase